MSLHSPEPPSRLDNHPRASSPANGHSHESPIIDIAPAGDLVLCITHETTSKVHSHRFRVSCTPLRANSRYFARLLQGRFGESEQVDIIHAELRKIYGNDFATIPVAELPAVKIEHVGRISAVKSIEALCTDFLGIMHDKDIPPIPPVANIANLAIVADRFDALETVRAYIRRKKTLRAIDSKTLPKAENALSEEKVRQRLLVGLLLDYPPWTERYSARMVIRGWVGREVDPETSALWYDLPSRVEEELALRRDHVLETIQSLQNYLLGLYTSRERQCKLGYDSSGQCDSFQLGEMVRFFLRIEALQLRGTIMETEPSEAFEGDINVLIDKLKQAPEYQIDKFHTHCGIRTRIVPLLDLLLECLPYVGLCQECWLINRAEHAWLDSKRPLLWKRAQHRSRSSGHKELHTNVRMLFTAVERDWTS